MAHYILQLVFFQLAFLLAYDFFLKKETFFSYNRWYLLITPLLSLLLPFLQFDGLAEIAPAGSTVLLPEVFIGAAPQETVSVGAKPVASGFQINWWWIAYFCGFLINLILFSRKYRMLKNLNRNAVISEEKKWKVIEVPDSNCAFTFYRTIFLGDRLSETEKQQVLAHELVHVRQKHTLDLLFFELQKIIFWFNPLVYIFQAKITDLHEFIADARAVKTTEKKEYYQQLLNTAFSTQNISFINQFFNHSLIKKRIVMLQKSKSKTVSKLKFLVIIPLMLGMLFYVSCSEEKKLAKIPQTVDKGEILELQVEDVYNLTEEEAVRRNELVNLLGTEGNPNTLIVRDEASSRRIFVDNHPGTSPPPPPPSVSEDVKTVSEQEVKDIPFAIVEELPVYPGCEDLDTDKEKKACISEKITMFVNSNFDTSLGKKLGLTGLNRVYVQFRINSDGVVEVLRVRAPHEALEEEARRVVNGLPKMVEPAKQDGKNVGVLYALPISFMTPG